MTFQEFPKWKYAAGGLNTIVETADEEAALGPGWYDAPPQGEAGEDPLPVEREPSGLDAIEGVSSAEDPEGTEPAADSESEPPLPDGRGSEARRTAKKRARK